jgi:AcrR family transcriptional regulator
VPKVTEEYRVARRDEIADAALRAFRRKGFQATSMAEIIAESGLSAGAIYGHYPSKDAIIVDVASRVVGNRILDVERLASTEPLAPPSTIPRVLIGGMTRALGNPAIMLQLWGEGVTEPAVRTVAHDVIVRLRGALAGYTSLWHQRTHGTPPDEADALGAEQAPLLIAAVQGFVVQSAIVPDFDADTYLRAVEKYLPS